MNVFLHCKVSSKNCRKGLITSKPPAGPQVITPVAKERLFKKYRGTMTKLVV